MANPQPHTCIHVLLHESRTTTFLMTDIEGSTRLWEERPGAMAAALEAHDSLLREAVERADGTVVKTTGDGVLAAFETPDRAVSAAIEAQLALASNDWPEIGSLRVRMAIHAGGAESREGDFHGPTLNRVARLLAIGHGGQVLVPADTHERDEAMLPGALAGCPGGAGPPQRSRTA